MNTIIRAATLFLGLVWVAFASVAAAETLPYAKPEEVGFSSERLGRVTEMLRTNIAAGEIPGAVLLIARRGKIAYFESLGLLDPQAKTPMRKDAIFRIYSMSKPITSAAAMILFEEAKFALNEPVGKYIPALAKMQVATDNKPDPEADPHKLVLVPANRPISIQDLMRHTSGLTYGFFGETPVKKVYLEADLGNWAGTNAEFVERIAKLPLSERCSERSIRPKRYRRSPAVTGTIGGTTSVCSARARRSRPMSASRCCTARATMSPSSAPWRRPATRVRKSLSWRRPMSGNSAT